MRTCQLRKARGRNLPTALQAEPVQVTEGSQLGKALVPYSVAALHVELGQVVQAGQTGQLFPYKEATAFVDRLPVPFHFGLIGRFPAPPRSRCCLLACTIRGPLYV